MTATRTRRVVGRTDRCAASITANLIVAHDQGTDLGATAFYVHDKEAEPERHMGVIVTPDGDEVMIRSCGVLRRGDGITELHPVSVNSAPILRAGVTEGDWTHLMDRIFIALRQSYEMGRVAA